MSGRQQGNGENARRRAARQERLADKLRQNLVRRKAKARTGRDAVREPQRPLPAAFGADENEP